MSFLPASGAAWLLPLLLLGARPEAPGTLRMADSVTWYTTAGSGSEPPRVVAPCPGETGGWRVAFRGEDGRRGYAEVPLDGDRLQAAGFEAIRIEYRTGGAGDVPDLVLLTAAGGYRARLPATSGRWTTRSVAVGDFTPFGNVSVPLETNAPRRLRVEAPELGLRSDAVLDVRSIALESSAASAEAAAARRRAPVPSSPFLRGPFLLGGNRSLLDPLGTAGGNVTVEYSAAWSRLAVEEHLDYARGEGVGVIAALTHEGPGLPTTADRRLAPLAGHPALAGWYVFDEPDGGTTRGIPAAMVSPATLAARARALAPVPTLVTCLNPIGLQAYARCATMLATDYFLPAFDPDRPLTTIHADAEAVVETAARTGATPLIVLQLAHYGWPNVQTPASLRAQTLASVAAGVRGVLFFQGAAAARAADGGAEGSDLWDAFLAVCGELAALAPLAEGWTRVPGEPSLGEEMGEVRAACFADGDESWIVLVNLAREALPVRLGGDRLRGARRLEEPGSGWSVPVRDGGWEGTLAPLEGHVLRVERDGRKRSAPRVTERLPIGGEGPLRFDRVVAGGTLFPAPGGPVRVEIDGADRTPEANVRTGPALIVRLPVRDLDEGTHEVALSWEHDGAPAREAWTFDLAPPVRPPVRDDFDRAELGPAWGVGDDVVWDFFAEDETRAEGSVAVEDGELHVLSTGGGIGARLRYFEAPPRFRVRVTARLAAPGQIEVERGDLHHRIDLPAGRSRVEIDETDGVRVIRVDGAEVLRERLFIYHRGGSLGLGVPHGGEAWFDDFEVVVP